MWGWLIHTSYCYYRLASFLNCNNHNKWCFHSRPRTLCPRCKIITSYLFVYSLTILFHKKTESKLLFSFFLYTYIFFTKQAIFPIFLFSILNCPFLNFVWCFSCCSIMCELQLFSAIFTMHKNCTLMRDRKLGTDWW